MTICAASLTPAEKTRFNQLRKNKTVAEKQAMDKQLSKIVQAAISNAPEAQADAINSGIALGCIRAFKLNKP
jgi:hypothetical protein